MSYPIPLGRYDKVLITTFRAKVPCNPAELVGGDASRWEIIGVTANAQLWLVRLGQVRVGLKVRAVTDELEDR